MPDRDRILYRLIDPHEIYGAIGRCYSPDAYKAIPHYHKALFEKVNAGLTDYHMVEKKVGDITEIYLLD